LSEAADPGAGKSRSILLSNRCPDLSWDKLGNLPLDPHWSANHWQDHFQPTLSYRVLNSWRKWRWLVRLSAHRVRRRLGGKGDRRVRERLIKILRLRRADEGGSTIK